MGLPLPELVHSFTLTVELGQPIEMGKGRAGERRIIPITGGKAHGPDVIGRVLDLGADWQTVFDDGVAQLDTRYGIETSDGAIIDVINVGVRHGPKEVMARLASGEDVDPSTYYMRTSARLETGDDRYDWVNYSLFICAGQRKANAVEIAYHKVL